MGYRTDFEGELKFNESISIEEVRKIKEYFDTDLSLNFRFNGGYIDLELTDLMDGLKWNGAEKSYNMKEQIEFLIKEVTKDFPDFSLNGVFDAQGEDVDDKCQIIVKDNVVSIKKIVLSEDEKVITCPHCGEMFIYNLRDSR